MHVRTVRESLETDNLFIPQLNGLANAYKPPLLFWAGMLSDVLFGESFLSERLVSLLFGFLTTILLYCGILAFGKSSRFAFQISLVYASTFAAWKFSRLLMMEQMLTFFLFLFVYLYLRFQKEKKIAYFLFGIISLNIAYFIKGPLVIFYAIVLPLSFLAVDLLRIRKRKLNVNWQSILKYKHILLFPLSFLIPILWMFYLSRYSNEGALLIKFFLFNENVGKFFSENQPMLRILGGWLLYTIPFTPFLFLFISRVISTKINTREKRILRVIAYFLLGLTLLHLLPNRKDSYYVTPFIPILFLGVSLSLSEAKITSYFENPWLGRIYILLFIGIAIFSFWNSESKILIVSAVTILFLFVSLYTQYRFQIQFLISVLFIPLIAGIILPTFQNPLPANDLQSFQLTRLCVVSENPWHGMDYQNQLRKTMVIYSPPSSATDLCENQNLPILSLSNFYSPGKKYIPSISWYVWKAHLEIGVNDFLEIVQNVHSLKFKEQIQFYEVERR
ncbi:dolichyl-phosphate-mannose-protein mannosyltransferase [Leptospira ryugenii]|uniref:Dolichyl-phosphate-mannose-protein mannosyltransferase n=2 Tax=Leptospira ryugenii TaxID=1917863 RepID=A0A2P2E499_9LEPT|nr:dolichyl-phosphate-mannose-protein mannosyltransferase [Leptospira ryugenii]